MEAQLYLQVCRSRSIFDFLLGHMCELSASVCVLAVYAQQMYMCATPEEPSCQAKLFSRENIRAPY